MANKAKGGFKPAKNFEPGRGKAKAGSKSPKHRGYRADEAPAKKSRWSADDRAARTDRSDRTREGRDDRPRYDRDARPARGARDDRPRYDRDDRNRDARPARTDRFDRSERPRFDRDDRGGRPARNDRFDRTDRPRYDRDARPARGDRPDWAPRSDRTDRAHRDDRARTDRPQHDRVERRSSRYFDERGVERAGRDDRPRYDRDDRPRSDRPRYDRDDRARTERPRYNREERPRHDGARSERPRYDREDRSRNDRPRFDGNDRNDRSRSERPRYEREERPRYDRDSRPEQRFTPQDDVVLERLQAQATEATDVEGVTFDQLGLGQNIVRSLADLGASSPFPIQAATIPDVLAGRDVLGRGRTGSGKTIAFGAPLVERLLGLAANQPKGSVEGEEKLVRGERAPRRRQQGRNPRALILAPTRELALQIDRTVQPIAQSVGLFTTQIYGGVPQARQVGALQRGVDIVIGTPGRIEDLIEQGRLSLRDVQITVLDEADHMCDLGFLEPVQRILRQTAPGGQKLLFSATLDKGVASLVKEFLPEPSVHEVAGEDQASGTIDHRVLLVNREDKLDVIQQLVDRPGKTLVFSRTRAYAERLAEELEDAGIPAVSLHGDLNQSRRTRNLEKLTKGRVNVLVATDVAARGIHVDDIDLVVQADPPDEYKTYLHRAGRTGRAGKQGMVVTLIPRNRQKKTKELLQRAEIDAEATAFYPGDKL